MSLIDRQYDSTRPRTGKVQDIQEIQEIQEIQKNTEKYRKIQKYSTVQLYDSEYSLHSTVLVQLYGYSLS